MYVYFEAATPSEADARQVMVWRNDPITLRSFYHTAPKRWPEFHAEFRERYFLDPALPPLFAICRGERIGFVRLDRYRGPHEGLTAALPPGAAAPLLDISVNLDPSRRGQGAGAAIITAAVAHAGRAGFGAVVAEIRRDNPASIRAFEAAGFRLVDATTHRVADTGEDVEIFRLLAHSRPRPAASLPGLDRPVYVIAEAGSNWRAGSPDRDWDQARRLIDVAVAAGADAVKFQTYRPGTTYVANAGSSDYLSEAGIKRSINDIFADLSMPYDMVPRLAAVCADAGIDFMSTPFSVADADAVDDFCARHKLASYEISHLRLLERLAGTGKPLIASTGASDPDDIAWMVQHFYRSGGTDLTLLQCTARYPAPPDSLNLRTLPWLAARYDVAVGLSDHSRHPTHAPVAAVALGASVIEKHYTLANDLPGPDHAFAVEPDELAALVAAVRMAEEMRGTGVKAVLPAEEELAAYARRGLQATRDIAPGEPLREGVNLDILRPGKQRLGVHPRHLPELEGKAAARAIPLGDGVQPGDWS